MDTPLLALQGLFGEKKTPIKYLNLVWMHQTVLASHVAKSGATLRRMPQHAAFFGITIPLQSSGHPSLCIFDRLLWSLTLLLKVLSWHIWCQDIYLERQSGNLSTLNKTTLLLPAPSCSSTLGCAGRAVFSRISVYSLFVPSRGFSAAKGGSCSVLVGMH